VAFRKQRPAGYHARIQITGMKTENILVPIDFSEMSIQAIDTAKRLAQRFGATVHLAHVHHFYYPVGFEARTAPMPFSLPSYDEQLEKRALFQLRALAKTHGLSPANCHVLTGGPAFDEICALAKEIPADLIVMSSHGRTGLKHFVLGSTAERIVQHSHCPVFVARPDNSRNGSRAVTNTILVPIDFSECSLDGVNYAIAFAEKFGAKLILLHAFHIGYAYTADGYAMYDLSQIAAIAFKEAGRQMREFVGSIKFGRVAHETRIVTGTPVDEICAFARGHNVDLIITPTHGLTGFKHVLIGSTAEQIVRRAPRPVLVVPSHPALRMANLIGRPPTERNVQTNFATSGAVRAVVDRLSLTRKDRKRTAHAFPERRRTNKFRETHLLK
jgi:nucleotide-binding universal stress UspA family protein